MYSVLWLSRRKNKEKGFNFSKLYIRYLTWSLIESFGVSSRDVIILHKKIIRIITNSEFRCHTPPLFFDLKLLTIKDIYSLKLAISLHNFQNDKYTGSNNFIPLQNVHSHNTRLSNKNNYYQHQTSTNLAKSTYSSAAIRFWRSVPENIKSSSLVVFLFSMSSIQLFKSEF